MMGGECDGVVHHLSRCEVPGLLFICNCICRDFSVREFVAVPLYHFRAHLHCGMPATGRELAQLQRLNSPSGPP